MLRNVLAGLAGLSLLLPVAVAAQDAAPITLRVADHYPAGASTPEYTIKYFMDAVTKAAGGKVKFEYYPAEQLGKAKDMLALTQQGVVDIGQVAPAYVSDKMPLSAVAELPGTFTTSCQGAKAYDALAQQGVLKDKEFATNGIKPLIVFILPPYQILTRGKLDSLADIRGLKLRSAGGAMDITIRRLSAVPIRMGGPDVYSALSRGTIDGVVFPLLPVLEFKLQDHLKAGTIGENFGGFATTYSISERRWNALPADIRKIMTEAGEDATRHACDMLDRDNSPAEDVLRKAGLTMAELPAADHAAIRELLRPVQTDWAKGVDARGLPGSEILKAFLAAVPPRLPTLR
jgi:TRAP-type C4-dicarboxylate transport system substrate-binding protein